MPEPVGRARFPTTRWSLVLAAQEEKPGSGVLNTLCELYWLPVYAFIRHAGHSATEAEDLCQGFFAALLEKHYVRSADRDRGRFRAFLLGSLKHFLSHERERALAQKRGGRIQHVPLDATAAEEWYQSELPAATATPEQVFERRWAMELLDTALEQLRTECEQSGRKRQFEVLAPLLESSRSTGYETAAAELGISSGAARVAVHRLRLRFRTLLRQLIGATVSTSDRLNDEIQYLFTAVRQ